MTNTQHVTHLPNSSHLVHTTAGPLLVHCPPETLKYLLANKLDTPHLILLPPDIPAGQQLGSAGFVHQGINYAAVEFMLYANFFGGGGRRTKIVAPTSLQAARIYRILQETTIGPQNTAEYGRFGWLKHEIGAVGYYPPIGHAPGPDDLAEFIALDTTDGDLPGGLRIEITPDEYRIHDQGQHIATLPRAISGATAPLRLAPAQSVEHRQLTLQFIGGSDGFDPQGITTCFIGYLNAANPNQTTLFDCAAYLRLRLNNLGISPAQISELVLTHLHEDHMAGLPELLLMGDHRVRLLTSHLIYNSLIRVLVDMLDLKETYIKNLFEFIPLEPDHPIELDGRTFASNYSVHSIPTLAIHANNLYFSGDMRYDEDWYAELVEAGIFTPERRQSLIDFAAHGDIVVHDAGTGPIHTTFTPAVLRSLYRPGRRLILAHTAKHELPTDGLDANWLSAVEFASSGHVTALGDQILHISGVTPADLFESLTACPLIARLPEEWRRDLSHSLTPLTFENGQTIINDGDPANGTAYIVHTGIVQVWNHEQLVLAVGRGSSLGERGALEGGTRQNSLVASGRVQLIPLGPSVFPPIAEALNLRAGFARAEWLRLQPTFQDMLWSSLLDLALDFQPRHLAPGERLFSYGDVGHEAYLLVSGAITITNKDNQPIDILTSPCEFFGARSALYNTARNASAYAKVPSDVWALPGTALQRVQTIYPNLIMHLHAVEAGRHGILRRPGDTPLNRSYG